MHLKRFLFEYVYPRLLHSLHYEGKWNILFLDTVHLSGFSLVNWNPTVLLITNIFFSHLIYKFCEQQLILLVFKWCYNRFLQMLWGSLTPQLRNFRGILSYLDKHHFSRSFDYDVKLFKVSLLTSGFLGNGLDFTVPTKCNLKMTPEKHHVEINSTYLKENHPFCLKSSFYCHLFKSSKVQPQMELSSESLCQLPFFLLYSPVILCL